MLYNNKPAKDDEWRDHYLDTIHLLYVSIFADTVAAAGKMAGGLYYLN